MAITIVRATPTTPAELQAVLDNPEIQPITLHVAHVGKIAWYHVKKGRSEFQSVLDNAKTQILKNFRSCYRLEESELVAKVESIFT